MKRLQRLFMLILCCAATVSFTSCLSDDNDSGIDDTTYQSWLTSISGSYAGSSSNWQLQNKIYFYNDEITDATNTTKTDSICDVYVRYYKNDSIVTVEEVPGYVFAKEITGNDALKKALQNTEVMQTLKAKFVFYNISSPYAYYAVYPYSIEYPNLAYENGETHKVTVNFVSGAYSGIYYSSSVNSMNQFSLYVANIYVDGKLDQTIYDGSSDDEKATRACLTVFCSR